MGTLSSLLVKLQTEISHERAVESPGVSYEAAVTQVGGFAYDSIMFRLSAVGQVRVCVYSNMGSKLCKRGFD